MLSSFIFAIKQPVLFLRKPTSIFFPSPRPRWSGDRVQDKVVFSSLTFSLRVPTFSSPKKQIQRMISSAFKLLSSQLECSCRETVCDWMELARVCESFLHERRSRVSSKVALRKERSDMSAGNMSNVNYSVADARGKEDCRL